MHLHGSVFEIPLQFKDCLLCHQPTYESYLLILISNRLSVPTNEQNMVGIVLYRLLTYVHSLTLCPCSSKYLDPP